MLSVVKCLCHALQTIGMPTLVSGERLCAAAEVAVPARSRGDARVSGKRGDSADIVVGLFADGVKC